MNVIGDIAGQYEALMELLGKMPDQETLSVGDMIDRGPESRQVLEWFMKHGDALLGNHEHMMLDWYFKWGNYQDGIWEMNGGSATKAQFREEFLDSILDGEEHEVISWLNTRNVVYGHGDFVISHSFIPAGNPTVMEMIWNRSEPVRKDQFQIAGHNSHFGLKAWGDRDSFDRFSAYALCIDTSAMGMVCGIDLETMRIYTQEYI